MESMHHYERQLLNAAEHALKKGLLTRSDSFLSARIPQTDRILMVPGAIFLDEGITPGCISIDLKSDLLKASEYKSIPYLEFVADAYAQRSEINAVGHFHPPHALTVSRMDCEFPLERPGVRKKVGEVLRVVCRSCSSRFAGLCSCFENMRAGPSGVNALLIENDGIVTLHKNLHGILRLAEQMEQSAQDFLERQSDRRV